MMQDDDGGWRTILQLCERCGGEGRLYRGHPNDPNPVDCGECPVCEGTGGALIPAEPVTEEEIMAGICPQCGNATYHPDCKAHRQ